MMGEEYERRQKEALHFIHHVTTNAQAVQEQVLSAILSRNAHTEYLQRHGMAGRTDKETFKRLLPLITYEDLQPEIQRIANGDTSPILSAQPISEFLTSSGTSAGERKLMPTISEEFERRSLLYSLLMPVMNQYVADLDKGKGMYFLFVRPEAKTPGGLLARPVLTSYYKSPHFMHRPHDPYNVLTSPDQVVLCPDAHQAMYCHLLCGLVQREEVLRMGAVFASGFLRAIRYLEVHWEQLVEDIRVGEVSEAVVTDAATREAVERVIGGLPRPELAEAIGKECARSDWQGILSRLWPNTKYIEVVITGTMAQYIPTLDYYSAGLPLASTMYASSECYFGINLQPLCHPSRVTYTLLPNMCYYEFLPVKRTGADHSHFTPTDDAQHHLLLDLHNLQVGHQYELVLTTYAGLYRYRVGDVLRVTGFHNSAPQFHFVCRKNVLLSIDADKTDEEDLHAAVTSAVQQHLHPHQARLIEYTSYAHTSAIPGHYVIYWELRSERALSPDLFQDCCCTLEASLDVIYRAGRVEGSIGPLEIRLVKPGTFDALMDYALTRGASINQYKTPRCIKFYPIVQLLDARVTSSHFSNRLPHWRPDRP